MEKILVVGGVPISARYSLDKRIEASGWGRHSFVSKALTPILRGDYAGFVFVGVGFTHDELEAARATGRPYLKLQLEQRDWPEVLEKFLACLKKKNQPFESLLEDAMIADNTVVPKKRILVVDDEPGIRSLLHDLLDGAEFSVTTAGNGQEGKALLEKNQFDLVVSDIDMPVMDGCQLYRWWEESPRSSTAKFIFMSTHNPADYGIVEPIWVTKPFAIADMLSAVKKVLAAAK